MQRPTSVTVFGVLNLVFGALGLLNTGISAISLFAINAQAEAVDPFAGAPPMFGTWMKISMILGLVAAILLIVSGVGLLSLRPWGRSLAIGYSAYAIVFGVVSVVAAFFMVAQPTVEQLQAKGDPEAVGIMVGMGIGALVGGCIWLIYPALLWYFMTRPHVIAAFSGLSLETSKPSWSPPVFEPWTPAESRNPYVPPRAADIPSAPSGGISESIVETFVPSRNGPALASYYLGIFSLIPCLGFPMGIAAICYGVIGLRRVRANPAVRGGAHAWVGIICGSLFGLFNFVLLVLAIVGIIAGMANR